MQAMKEKGFSSLLVLLIILFAVVAAAAFDHVRKAQNPLPDDPVIRQAAIAKQEELESVIKSLASGLDIAFLSTAHSDRCKAGQNNWKVHEGFDKRCQVRASQFYGFNSNIQDKLLQIEEKLLATGWKYYIDTINKPITRDLERFHEKDPRTDVLPDSNNGYKSQHYIRENSSKSLSIRCADRTTNLYGFDTDQLVFPGSGSGFDYTSDHILKHDPMESMFSKSPYAFLCMIGITDTYFEAS